MGVRVEKLELIQVCHELLPIPLENYNFSRTVKMYAGAIAILASQQGGENLLCRRGTDQNCAEVLDRSVPGKLLMRLYWASWQNVNGLLSHDKKTNCRVRFSGLLQVWLSLRWRFDLLD